MFAIGRQISASATVEGVRSGGRFRKCIRSNPLAGGQLRQVLFLLLRSAEVNDRQRANSNVRTPGNAEASRFGNVIGDDGGSDFVHLHPAVLFRNVYRRETEFAGLLDEIACDSKFLMLDLLEIRNDLFQCKLFRSLSDLAMFVSEVFRCENFLRLTIFYQETATGDFRFRNRCGCH